MCTAVAGAAGDDESLALALGAVELAELGMIDDAGAPVDLWEAVQAEATSARAVRHSASRPKRRAKAAGDVEVIAPR